MVLTNAFQLFHTKTSKTSQKLGCCIKSNYWFFTGLWTLEDLRGTTASGQKLKLTFSCKPWPTTWNDEERNCIFTTKCSVFHRHCGQYYLPTWLRARNHTTAKETINQLSNRLTWNIPIHDTNAIVILQMNPETRGKQPKTYTRRVRADICYFTISRHVGFKHALYCPFCASDNQQWRKRTFLTPSPWVLHSNQNTCKLVG